MAKPPVLKPFEKLQRWALAVTNNDRAEGTVQHALATRVERLLAVAERAANLELRLLERLEPIVDNLGELVRIQLDEARAARDARRGRTTPDPGGRVIDVTSRKADTD